MTDDIGNGKTVLVVGATGYIGNAVVAEAVQRGYDVIAVTRSLRTDCQFEGAEVVLADVSDPASIAKAFSGKIDIVISTLACRSGLPKDFDAIDYKATLNVLNAALENGTDQFILLSAICVRKPDLPLQLAKLKMEDALIRSGIDYTIVRPTAYFWVFDVQTKMIEKGKPGYLIGSGDQACHNPISKEDLAEFLVGSIGNAERINRLHIIGGPEVPGNIVTYKESLLMIFESLGIEPKLVNIPGWAVVAVVRITKFIGFFFRKIGVFSEFLKVLYYYLENDMRAPGYGSMTLKQHLLDITSKVET
jgi:divinyl chlorophyllide a 8-vinyl-reductase